MPKGSCASCAKAESIGKLVSPGVANFLLSSCVPVALQALDQVCSLWVTRLP